jgi:regulator of replication initiation timing
MTKRKRLFRTSIDTMEAELRKLRLENQQLKDQVRAERRRANQHADEVAMIRQQQVAQVQRNGWVNGVTR